MLLDAYYLLKPLIPRRLQISMRRARARWKLKTHANVWPIDERAAVPPPGWKGWPDGKKFAFVITHDVDTEAGLNRCRDLMKVDQEFGFVSSFNFVPEKYDVPADLREELTRNGFEVGVHDMRHDGKLFRSRREFQEAAKSINRYLREWNAVGFRAGAMHHNAEWIHDLDIQYDSSTFDTDPFEPQPDGTRTIFPFWVPDKNKKRGYIEIPYTLPQDFTLFVILLEKTIDIWKKKANWIRDKGGIALLNVHPDYINFDNTKNYLEKYDVKYYFELLKYISKSFHDEFWNTVPREIAKYCTNGIT